MILNLLNDRKINSNSELRIQINYWFLYRFDILFYMHSYIVSFWIFRWKVSTDRRTYGSYESLYSGLKFHAVLYLSSLLHLVRRLWEQRVVLRAKPWLHVLDSAVPWDSVKPHLPHRQEIAIQERIPEACGGSTPTILLESKCTLYFSHLSYLLFYVARFLFSIWRFARREERL